MLGHVIVHAPAAVTVTVKLQVGPELGVVQVTVVVPTGKLVPDAGAHVANTPAQVLGAS
jgi:hypothetical protein